MAVTFPAAAAPGVQYQEQSESRILYHEESGGLVKTVPPPQGAGSAKRAPIAPQPQLAPSPLARKSVAPPKARKEAAAPKPQKEAAASKSRKQAAKPPMREEATPATRLVSCEKPDEAWAAADALARAGDIDRARALLEPLAAGCTSDAVRLTSLSRLQRLTYVHLLDRAAQARGSAVERAKALADSAGPLIVSFRDSPVALSLGWLWLEGKDPASASLWFNRARTWAPGLAEATRGAALAALAENDPERALALADELPASEAQRVSIRSDALLALAQRHYRSERYVDAIERFEAAAKLGPLPRYARALQAWSVLALGDRRAAGDLFTVLYRESPDLETAQGLMAATRDGATAIDPWLSESEPLASLLRKSRATQAFSARRFLEARELDPERYAEIGASGVPQAAAAASWREKSGDEGLSRLHAHANVIEVSALVCPDTSIGVRNERSYLRAGTPQPGVPVGAAAVDATEPAQALVSESRLTLKWEPGLAMTTTLGRGPVGGAISSRVLGGVNVVMAAPRGELTMSATSMPVRESVLSYAGMRDAATGETWGRVFRHGVEARALWLEHSPWSAGARLALARLDGVRVEDNRYAGAEISAGYDLRLDGFSYSALSLGASWEHYRRNLSHFTFGHGGYFSPQRYRRVGAAFDFMTQENRPWMVRGRASAGRVEKSEDAAPFFPLAPDTRAYTASHGIGNDATVQIAAAHTLGAYAQIGIALARSVSPQYSEKLALIQVKVLFEPRHHVASVDLPVLSP